MIGSPQSTSCNTCGLRYVPSHKPDNELHEQMHRQWKEVSQIYGIAPQWTRELYESEKCKYRHIFYTLSQYSLDERVGAAIEYLHTQWIDRGLWNSIRYDYYSSFEKEYPDIPSWIRTNYSEYKHEFSSDVQSAICKRYGIPSEITMKG